jgi:hypothetical protein
MKKDQKAIVAKEQEGFAFKPVNYKLMLAGVAVIVLGFLLMMGGGSDDPMVFNEDIFSTRRITIAPLVTLLGYGIVFYAILKRAVNQEKKAV